MARLELEKYVKTRKKFKWIGWIAISAAIFHMLDPAIPFPIPFRGWLGNYIALAIIFTAVGMLIYAYRRPNLKMIMEVAKIYNGYLTTSCLIDVLSIPARQAEYTIVNLFKTGYVDIVNRVENATPISHWACQFIGLSVRGVSKPPAESRRDNIANLAEHTAANPEMTVSEINDLLLNNSFNVGRSGQPRR